MTMPVFPFSTLGWPLPARRTALAMPLALVLAVMLGLLLAVPCAQARADTWPRVALPPGVSSFPVAGQVSVNGTPMQMHGFIAAAPPAQVAAWFRANMSTPLVEDRVGDKLVLGRAEGGYFISVQLAALSGPVRGTRGVVAVSHLRQGYEARAETRAQHQRLLERLPYATRLISQMSSTDGGRLGTYLLAENGHSAALNRDSLIVSLRADGLELEREARADPKTAQRLPDQYQHARTLSFKGRGKEAVAVIREGSGGRTTIVINTVNHMEQLK